MALALIAALGIAVCYGLATVMQSIAAKATAGSAGLDPGLLLRLLRSAPYVGGLLLDGAGFVLTVFALQTLPLFVVEAFTAGALAVTAVAAATWLRIPLTRGEWIGVGAVTAGLVALGLSAGADVATAIPEWERWLPLVLSLLLFLASVAVARIPGPWGVTSLGAISGFGFGLVGIATRCLQQPITPTGLLTDPATYAIIAGGGLGLLTLATALQRGSVTQATAAMVVAETVIPSAVGLAFLGDRVRPGFQMVALVGLIVAVGGSVSLARMGEIPASDHASP